MECSRMAMFSPVFSESLTATARRVSSKLPVAYGSQFADQSHAVFYGKPRAVSYRLKHVGEPCKSGVQFEMATVDDESVEEVVRQLEDLQRKVKAKKKELKAKKKMMKKMSKKVCKKGSSSSSSSSESSESSDSSDDECDKMNMKMLRKKMKGNGAVSNNVTLAISDAIDTVATAVETEASHIEEVTSAAIQTAATICGKIEVCTGGKCKKNGSQQVLAAFQSRIEGSPAVVASKCKCMGMCGKGPNVRLQKNEAGNTLVVNGVNPEDVDLLLQELFQISSLSALPAFLASTKSDVAF